MSTKKARVTGVTDVTDHPIMTVTRAHARVRDGCKEQSVTSVTPVTPVVPDPTMTVLALDLGTTTGWALRSADGPIVSGTVSLRPSRFDGGGVRFLRFRAWLDGIAKDAGGIHLISYEEIRRHLSTDSSHVYGGLLAMLNAWCEHHGIPYQGVPVGTIKRHITGKGNADKAAVIAAVRARGFNPADDNEADAIAILLWAIETQGGVR